MSRGRAVDEAFFARQTLKVPDDSLGFLLWRATHAWQRRLDQALAPTGLTHLRFALVVALGWLTRSGEDVSQRRLADFLSMHPMQVSQVVTALDKAGLVERSPSPKDGRALLLRLTDAGAQALEDATPIVADAHRRFFDRPGVDPADLRAMLGALPI